MGHSQSVATRMRVPLQAPTKPFLATSHGVISESATSYRMQVKLASSFNVIEVVDDHSNQTKFRFQSSSLSARRSLVTPSGRVLMSMEPHRFGDMRVYAGDQTDDVSFEMHQQPHISTPSVYADFRDALSGDACRVIREDNVDNDEMLVYLERGQLNLPPMGLHDDHTSSRFQAIGRFHRKKITDLVSPDEIFYVDAAPRVDLTLLLLLWREHFDSLHLRGRYEW